jgi:hypothetical protein
MLSRGLASIEDAFSAGRVHSQRYIKTTSIVTFNRWVDTSFSGGQPGYDARIGTALGFVPVTNSNNDAIYTGQPVDARGMTKHLVSATLRSDGYYPITVLVFDLLGYYPLIDGDSTDTQFFDNTLSLTRNTDGAGVLPVLVSSVAPASQDGLAVVTYTDAAGCAQTTAPFYVSANTYTGQFLCGASAATTIPGAFSLPLPAGSAYGARSVSSIQYLTPPSGLQSLYLIRPIALLTTNGDRGLATEKTFSTLPAIPDGTALNLAYYSALAGNSFFGEFTFAWA